MTGHFSRRAPAAKRGLDGLELVLPLPPSINTRRAHPMAEYRAKNEYRGAAWLRACEQAMPSAEADLPPCVVVHAAFFVRNRCDRVDNLPAARWGMKVLMGAHKKLDNWWEPWYVVGVQRPMVARCHDHSL